MNAITIYDTIRERYEKQAKPLYSEIEAMQDKCNQYQRQIDAARKQIQSMRRFPLHYLTGYGERPCRHSLGSMQHIMESLNGLIYDSKYVQTPEDAGLIQRKFSQGLNVLAEELNRSYKITANNYQNLMKLQVDLRLMKALKDNA